MKRVIGRKKAWSRRWNNVCRPGDAGAVDYDGGRRDGNKLSAHILEVKLTDLVTDGM